jgi:hypothetical protein
MRSYLVDPGSLIDRVDDTGDEILFGAFSISAVTSGDDQELSQQSGQEFVGKVK